MKFSRHLRVIASQIILVSIVFIIWTTPTLAHRSPDNCTGSGIGITLFANVPEIKIGDPISYSVNIFNGIKDGPVVCDASNIKAYIITPDGISHPITLVRTTLSSSQSNLYSNIIEYTARIEDLKTGNIFIASASDSADIHQNDTNSQGGSTQSVNTIVTNIPIDLVPLHIIKTVINKNGGKAIASDFMIHVKNSIGADVSGSPASGLNTPGTLYTLHTGIYKISEDINSSYITSFSGDCDLEGKVTLVSNSNKTCIVTNTDILSLTPITPIIPPAPPSPPEIIKKSTSSGGSSNPDSNPKIYTNNIPVTPASLEEIMPYEQNISFPSTGFAPFGQDIFENFNENLESINYFKIKQEIKKGYPIKIIIPKLKINKDIEYVGINKDGQLDSSKDPSGIAWFKDGTLPGEIGSAVIDGHSGWKHDIQAIFDNLSSLKKGDKIFILNDKDETIEFIVRKIKVLDREDNTFPIFNSDDGISHLNLITCGGIWDNLKKEYTKRIVIFSDKV